jgi:hypothetical protein
MEWTPDAEARLKEIPFFVRPAARKKIEKFAQAANATQITAEIYEQAKQKFGAKDEPFNLAPLPALPILCSVNISFPAQSYRAIVVFSSRPRSGS